MSKLGHGQGKTLCRVVAFCSYLLVIGCLLLACGGGSTKNTSTQDIINHVAARLDAVKSAHFAATIDGVAYIDTSRTIQLRSADGDIVPPDKMSAKIKIAIGPANVDVSLVTIGQDRYQTNPLTGAWGPVQPGFDYSPAILFDKDKGLSSVIKQMQNVERLGDDKVDGQAAYHLRGKVARAALEPLSSGAIEGDPVAVELWVAQDSSNLLKVVLTEPQTPNKPKPAVWTLTFTKYDQPVTIERPQ
ncbi:MAG: LppX_LprAFG lipoprotein [Thermomicrobiales bacterium]|nr:LppX_LprAFG lipoprotein [Thermomicrobiales bacterium]